MIPSRSSPDVVRTSHFSLESLEGRRLLHGGGGAQVLSTIEFDQAPADIQAGLTALASADSLAAPTATQTLYLGNSNGVETYSLKYTADGTVTKITVDDDGNAVTAPTKTTTTFGEITDTDVTDRISALATALGATAPASADSVTVVTPSGGTAVYTIKLTSTTDSGRTKRYVVSVDANGNPVGNGAIPFSAVPTIVQNALNANKPSGATAIDSASTQKVSVRTANGITTYSVKFSATGTTTVVTVNAAGELTNLPSTTTTTFSTIPIATQTELQELATAKGVSTAIASDATVRAYDQANGTVIYAITLVPDSSSGTRTRKVTLAVDQEGDPTVLPTGGLFANVVFGGTCFGRGGFKGFGHGGVSVAASVAKMLRL